jgi:hypothetical protein
MAHGEVLPPPMYNAPSSGHLGLLFGTAAVSGRTRSSCVHVAYAERKGIFTDVNRPTKGGKAAENVGTAMRTPSLRTVS